MSVKTTRNLQNLVKSKAFQEYHKKSSNELDILVEMEKIRRKQKLTQEDLARRMDMDQGDVSRILSGNRNFTLKVLERFCEATGTKIRFFSV